MSLTGSNADKRIQIRPSQQKLVAAHLLNEIRKQMGLETASLPASPVDVTKLAAELNANRGKSLVVSGSNDTEEQLLVNAINHMLDNYGQTIDTSVHLKIRQADDARMENFVEELSQGKIDGLVFYDVNPVYDYPDNNKIIEGLQKTALSISLSVLSDETSSLTRFVCPDHHFLESWNDFEVKTGHYSFSQPAIRPIFKTRSAQESLLTWAGKPVDYLTFIQQEWEKRPMPANASEKLSSEFWTRIIHDGVLESGETEKTTFAFDMAASDNALAAVDNITSDRKSTRLNSSHT